MNLIQFFNTESSSTPGLRAVKPIVYQQYLTITAGTGASFQSLLPSIAQGECAAYGGQIVNNGCYDLKITAYYLKGDDCDACTVDIISISTIEFYVPKNSVFPMPDGFYQKVDIQTVDSNRDPVSNTTDVKVSMHTSHAPNCSGCVQALNIEEVCYELSSGEICPTITTNVNGYQNAIGYGNPSQVGNRITITGVEVNGVMNLLDEPILISEVSPTLSATAEELAAEIKAKILPYYSAIIPQLNSVVVSFLDINANTKLVVWRMYDSTNLSRDYSGTCGALEPSDCGIWVFVTTNDNIQAGSGGNSGSLFTEEELTIPDPSCVVDVDTFKKVALNGVLTYYENGVVVTNQTRIAEIEDLIANDPNMSVVSC